MILPGTGRGTIREANGGGGASLRKSGVYAARKLRRTMSPPEVLLWSQVRSAKLGFKVRRQHPIGPYVADFFVPHAKLVIEIDGTAHDSGERPQWDAIRDRYLAEQGFAILRLTGHDVKRNLDGVLKLIIARVANPLHRPSDGPPSHAGEEQ